MSSRYNTIYLGAAGDVADELSVEDTTQDELRLALINAMLKIEQLEKLVARLRSNVNNQALRQVMDL